MPKSRIIHIEDQEVIGMHLRSKQWILYTGKLKIYDRKTNPIVLKLNSEFSGGFVSDHMESDKQFKGNSISEVFGKVAKWYYKNGIIFQN